MSFRFEKQKFLYNNKIFNVNDIYGVENEVANITDDSLKECSACMSNPKDTVILPCRHMCYCSDCSQIVRKQKNTCPMCRREIASFMQIKVTDDKEEAKSP